MVRIKKYSDTDYTRSVRNPYRLVREAVEIKGRTIKEQRKV